MQLYLFRHGIAEDVSADGSDFSRRLTKEGIDRTRRAVGGLSRLIDPPEHILSSPKVRAVETARLAAEVFERDITTEDALAHEALDPIIEAVRGHRAESLMLVGHEPTFSRLAEQLCTAGRAADFIELKKAGCLAIDLRPGGPLSGPRAVLLWALTPKVLRKLARE